MSPNTSQLDSETLARLEASVGGLPGEQEEVLCQLQRMEEAKAEPGFCGRLRRAVARAQTPIDTLASSIGIDGFMLQNFLEGTGTLDSTALERLTATLGLTLVYAGDPLAVIHPD